MVGAQAIALPVEARQFVGQIGIARVQLVGAFQIPDGRVEMIELIVRQSQTDPGHDVLWIGR